MTQVTLTQQKTNEPDTKALEQRIADLEKLIMEHRHTGKDKTEGIKGDIKLEDYESLSIGGGIISGGKSLFGTPTQIEYLYLISGKDKESGIGDVGTNAQIMLENNDGLELVAPQGETFFHGVRPPIVTGTVTIASGGSIISDKTKKLTASELVGAYVLVTNGTTTETHIVSANTTNSITITGTFTLSGSVIYTVFKPIYLGSVNYPWKRIYVTDTANGGVRFGQGPTSTNCLLYTDGDDLVFKNTAGTYYTVDMTSV